MTRDIEPCPDCGGPRDWSNLNRPVCQVCEETITPGQVIEKAVGRTHQPPKKTTLSKIQQTRLIARFEAAVEIRAVSGAPIFSERHEQHTARYEKARTELAEALAMLTPPGKVTRGTE